MNCLACGSNNVSEVLSLGHQSPVNRLTLEPGKLQSFPLALAACASCGHGQLTFHVPPEDLFVDYLYASSTSETLRNYSRDFALSLKNVVRPGGTVLEIACNDGILLSQLAAFEIPYVGVDPASQMVERCIESGLSDVVCDFWPTDKLDNLTFDVIVGQNVLAHNPNPLEFMAAVSQSLSPGGFSIFQTSQADMVLNGEFDTVYHEHFSFFSEKSARALSERAGLVFGGTSYTTIHGISSLYGFAKDAEGARRFDDFCRNLETKVAWLPPQASAKARLLRRERTENDWFSFAEDARKRMSEMVTVVEEARLQGRQIVAVGASAKGLTFLKAAGILPDVVLDDAIDKIGRWVDGLDCRITQLTGFSTEVPCTLVITAWNFSVEIMNKLKSSSKFPAGSVAVRYFPELEELYRW